MILLGLEIADDRVSHLDITAIPQSFEIGELIVKDGF
jgi:hypothetical protein